MENIPRGGLDSDSGCSADDSNADSGHGPSEEGEAHAHVLSTFNPSQPPPQVPPRAPTTKPSHRHPCPVHGEGDSLDSRQSKRSSINRLSDSAEAGRYGSQDLNDVSSSKTDPKSGHPSGAAHPESHVTIKPPQVPGRLKTKLPHLERPSGRRDGSYTWDDSAHNYGQQYSIPNKPRGRHSVDV